MNIVCVICSDRLTPSDDVFFTPCGHVFHFACLTQWLERSRTCPQCREKVTQNKIHRLYFNLCNNDTIVEDATSLLATVDSLKFQLLVKERECKQVLEKYNKSKTEAAGLRAEVRKLESEMTHKDTAILALKDQTKFFKNQAAQVDSSKKEVARLQNKIDEYRSIQMLINAPSEDVDEMISNTRDPARLITYITVMKRELTTSVARRRELRATLKKTQQELTKVSMERNFLLDEHEKRKELENILTVSESERRSLEERLRILENGSSSGALRNSASHQTVSSEPDTAPVEKSTVSNQAYPFSAKDNYSREFETRTANPETFRYRGIQQVKEKDSVEITSSPENVAGNEENSVRYTLKSQVGAATLKRIQGFTASSKYSMLAKKPRLAQIAGAERPKSEMCFDGFGGHSRNEKFPSPRKHSSEPKKSNRPVPAKRTKFDDGNNRRIDDLIVLDP